MHRRCRLGCRRGGCGERRLVRGGGVLDGAVPGRAQNAGGYLGKCGPQEVEAGGAASWTPAVPPAARAQRPRPRAGERTAGLVSAGPPPGRGRKPRVGPRAPPTPPAPPRARRRPPPPPPAALRPLCSGSGAGRGRGRGRGAGRGPSGGRFGHVGPARRLLPAGAQQDRVGGAAAAAGAAPGGLRRLRLGLVGAAGRVGRAGRGGRD